MFGRERSNFWKKCGEESKEKRDQKNQSTLEDPNLKMHETEREDGIVRQCGSHGNLRLFWNIGNQARSVTANKRYLWCGY